MKHTRGPWTFDEHGGNFYVWGPGHAMVADNDDEDGFVVTRMRGTGRGASDEEKQANAKLIAAAPDLLEACKLYKAWLEKDTDRECFEEGWQAMTAAIQKATGEHEG